MHVDREDHGFERVGTLDIETTHYDPEQGEIVSIGVGLHDRGRPSSEADYAALHRNGAGEVDLVKRAVEWLGERAVDGIVTYNGTNFDFEFIHSRVATYEEQFAADWLPPRLENTHVDLFVDRKRRANENGDKYPSLEECLASYGYPHPRTVWRGKEVTNARFGRELGPAYLAALDDESQRATLSEVIDHYLVTDLEANIALYYADIGAPFDPHHLETEREF